jgi:hypothetical protein
MMENEELRKQAIIASLNMRLGPNEDQKQHLTSFNDAQSDWYAFCPHCQKKVSGTLQQLREHSQSHAA